MGGYLDKVELSKVTRVGNQIIRGLSRFFPAFNHLVSLMNLDLSHLTVYDLDEYIITPSLIVLTDMERCALFLEKYLQWFSPLLTRSTIQQFASASSARERISNLARILTFYWEFVFRFLDLYIKVIGKEYSEIEYKYEGFISVKAQQKRVASHLARYLKNLDVDTEEKPYDFNFVIFNLPWTPFTGNTLLGIKLDIESVTAEIVYEVKPFFKVPYRKVLPGVFLKEIFVPLFPPTMKAALSL